MDPIRIASRVASLLPLPEVKEMAEDLLQDERNPELRSILEAIAQAAEQNSPNAYLLFEDFKEIQEEYDYNPSEDLKRMTAANRLRPFQTGLLL